MEGQDSKVTCLTEPRYETSESIAADTVPSWKLKLPVVTFPHDPGHCG